MDQKNNKNETNNNLIAMIKKDGLKAKGKNELLKHLEGGRLTHRQAIWARCYDCMGYFYDGRQDCLMPRCPLYPFMGFNRNKEKRNLKVLSDTHKARLQEGKKKAAGM